MAKFSNFTVQVEGWSAGHSNAEIGYGEEIGLGNVEAVSLAHEDARKRAPAEILLTLQSKFLEKTDPAVIKGIVKANSTGKSVDEMFAEMVIENFALGEKLVYNNINISENPPLGKEGTDGEALVGLLSVLGAKKDKFLDKGTQIGNLNQYAISDLQEEDDEDVLSLLKARGIYSEDPQHLQYNPKHVHAVTLNFHVQVDKFREILNELGVIVKNETKDFYGEQEDDVTPPWLRDPGTEKIPSNKLFKPPYYKSIEELRKYAINQPDFTAEEQAKYDSLRKKHDRGTALGTMYEEGTRFANSAIANWQIDISAATHMVATPITLLGKEALNNAISQLGMTVGQVTDIAERVKESTLDSIHPTKFFEIPQGNKEPDTLHPTLVKAGLAGLPTAYYPDKSRGSTSQFTLVAVSQYHVGPGGKYHQVYIQATSNDKLRAAIDLELEVINLDIQELKPEADKINEDGGGNNAAVEKQINLTEKGVNVYMGWIKASDLLMLKTKKNEFLRSLGIGIKRLTTDNDLRSDGTPVTKLVAWHKRQMFVPQLVKDVNVPWNSMYEIPISTPYKQWTKWSKAEARSMIRRIRRYQKAKALIKKYKLKERIPKKGSEVVYEDRFRKDKTKNSYLPEVTPLKPGEFKAGHHANDASIHSVGTGRKVIPIPQEDYEFLQDQGIIQNYKNVALRHLSEEDGIGGGMSYEEAQAKIAKVSGEFVSEWRMAWNTGRVGKNRRPSVPSLKELKANKSYREGRIRVAHVGAIILAIDFYNKDLDNMFMRTKHFQDNIQKYNQGRDKWPDKKQMMLAVATELYDAGLTKVDQPLKWHKPKKGNLQILCQIPANVWDGYPTSTERFKFDPPFLPVSADLIPEPLYGGPRPVKDLKVHYTFSKDYKWFEKNVIGFKETRTREFDPDKEIEVNSKLKRALKFYDGRHRKSGKKVLFPSFSSGPLNLRREANHLEMWKYNFRDFLDKNEFDFNSPPCSVTGQPEPKGSEGVSSPKHPSPESVIELGFNKSYQLIYVLFNGQPLKTGLNYFREKTMMGNPRTNALIHASPQILKNFSSAPNPPAGGSLTEEDSEYRLPWTKWVLTYIHPYGKAVIRPSKRNHKKKELPKLKKEPLSNKELERQKKLLADMKARDEKVKKARKKKFSVLDDNIKRIDKISNKITSLESAYTEILNRYGLDTLARTLAQCLMERTQDPQELMVNMALKPITTSLEQYSERISNQKSIKAVMNILNELPFECVVNVLGDICALEYAPETDVPPQIIPGLIAQDDKYKKASALLTSQASASATPIYSAKDDAKTILAVRPETAYAGYYKDDASGKNYNLKTSNWKPHPFPEDWKNDTEIVKEWQSYLANDFLEFQAQTNPNVGDYFDPTKEGFEAAEALTMFMKDMIKLGLIKDHQHGYKVSLTIDGIFGPLTERLTMWEPEPTDLTPQGLPWLTKAVYDKRLKQVADWKQKQQEEKEAEEAVAVIVKTGDTSDTSKVVQQFLLLDHPMLLGPDSTVPVYLARSKDLPDNIKPLTGLYQKTNGKWYLQSRYGNQKQDGTFQIKERHFKTDGKFHMLSTEAYYNFFFNVYEACEKEGLADHPMKKGYEEFVKSLGAEVKTADDIFGQVKKTKGTLVAEVRRPEYDLYAAEVNKVLKLKNQGSIDEKTGLKRPKHVLMHSPTPPPGYYCKSGNPGPCDRVYERLMSATARANMLKEGIKPLHFETNDPERDPDGIGKINDINALLKIIEKIEIEYKSCASRVGFLSYKDEEGVEVFFMGTEQQMEAKIDELAKKNIRVKQEPPAVGNATSINQEQQDRIDKRIEDLRKEGIKDTPKKEEEKDKCRKPRQALIDSLNLSYGNKAENLDPTKETPSWFWPGNSPTEYEKKLGENGEKLRQNRIKAMSDYIQCIEGSVIEQRAKMMDEIPSHSHSMGAIEPMPKNMRQLAMQLVIHQKWPENVKFRNADKLWSSCKTHCTEDALKLINYIIDEIGIPPETRALLSTLAQAAAVSTGLVSQDRYPQVPAITIPRGSFKKRPINDPDGSVHQEFKTIGLKILDETVKETVKALTQSIRLACAQNANDKEDLGLIEFDDMINPPFSPVDNGTVQDRLNDLQEMMNDWGLPILASGNMSPDNAVDDPIELQEMMNGLTSILTPTQMCACFDGEPSVITLEVLRTYYDEFYPFLANAWITDFDMIEFFRQMGKIVDPSFCNAVEEGFFVRTIPNPDQCLADIVIEERREGLKEDGFDPEDIDIAIAAEQKETIDAIAEAVEMAKDPTNALAPSPESEKQKCKNFTNMVNESQGLNSMLRDALEMTFDPIDGMYQRDIKFFVPSLVLGKNITTDFALLPSGKEQDKLISDLTGSLGGAEGGGGNNILSILASQSKEMSKKAVENSPVNTQSKKTAGMMETEPNPTYWNIYNAIRISKRDPETGAITLSDTLQPGAKLRNTIEADFPGFIADITNHVKNNQHLNEQKTKKLISDKTGLSEQRPKALPDASNTDLPNMRVAENLYNSLRKPKIWWSPDTEGESFNIIVGQGPTNRAEQISYLIHDLNITRDNYNIKIFNRNKQLSKSYFDLSSVYGYVEEYMKSNGIFLDMESSQKSVMKNYIVKNLRRFSQKNIPFEDIDYIKKFEDKTQDGHEAVRELYRSMNLTALKRLMKEVSASPLFMKNGLQKLNLSPSLDAAVDDCGIPLIKFGLEKMPNLLNVEEEIDEAIDGYKKRELEKCDKLPVDDDREPLNEVIEEATLRMLCKTFIIETLLKTVFSLSQFSAADCLSDDFIVEYITDSLIASARKRGLYESVLDTAQRMVITTRRSLYFEDPEIIPPKLGSSRRSPKVKNPLQSTRLPNSRTRKDSLQNLVEAQIEEVGAEFFKVLTSAVDVNSINTSKEDGLLSQITIPEPIEVFPYHKLVQDDGTNQMYIPWDDSLYDKRFNKVVTERPMGMSEEEFDNWENNNGSPLKVRDLVHEEGGFVLEKYIKINETIIDMKYDFAEKGEWKVAGQATRGAAWDKFLSSIPTYDGAFQNDPNADPEDTSNSYGNLNIARKRGLSNYCGLDAWKEYMQTVVSEVEHVHNVSKKKSKGYLEDGEMAGPFGGGPVYLPPQKDDEDVLQEYSDYKVLYAITDVALAEYGLNPHPGNVDAGNWLDYQSEKQYKWDVHYDTTILGCEKKIQEQRKNNYDVSLVNLRPIVDGWIEQSYVMATDALKNSFENPTTPATVAKMLIKKYSVDCPVGPWSGERDELLVDHVKWGEKGYEKEYTSAGKTQGEWEEFWNTGKILNMKGIGFRKSAAIYAHTWVIYQGITSAQDDPINHTNYTTAGSADGKTKNPFGATAFVVTDEQRASLGDETYFNSAKAAIASWGEPMKKWDVTYQQQNAPMPDAKWNQILNVANIAKQAVLDGGYFDEWYAQKADAYQVMHDQQKAEYKELSALQEALDKMEEAFDKKAKHAYKIVIKDPIRRFWENHGLFKTDDKGAGWKFGLRLTYVMPEGASESQVDDIRKLLDTITVTNEANFENDWDFTENETYHFRPDLPAQPLLKETRKLGNGQYKDTYMIPITEVEMDLPAHVKDQNLKHFINNLNGFYEQALPTLKQKLIKKADYRVLFNHVVPMRRLLSLVTLYNVMSIKYDGPTSKLFGSTKNTLFKTYQTALGDVPEASTKQDPGAFPSDEAMEETQEDDLASLIWDLFIKTPPQIIKGVAEIADPNIAISKSIYRGMQLIVKAIPDSVDASYLEKLKGDLGVTAAEQELAKEGLTEKQKASAKEQLDEAQKSFNEKVEEVNRKMKKSKEKAKKVVDDFPFPIISFGMLPSILPFGVGFPVPPFGPGIGPPLTQFGAAYLGMGLHKDPPDDQDKADDPNKLAMKEKCKKRLEAAESLEADVNNEEDF